MNRPIKFRAWDKITKQMCDVWDIGWKAWREGDAINYVKIYVDGHGINGVEDRLELDVELMQFTGLTDKNGKEIYEGDIVKKLAFNRVGEIYFKAAQFRYEPKDGSLNQALSDIFNECVIIGNIYENPEFMEGLV